MSNRHPAGILNNPAQAKEFLKLICQNALAIPEIRERNQQLSNIFRNTNYKEFDLAAILVETIQPQEPAITQEVPINSKAVQCSLCQRVFDKGENAWRGAKNRCKESCTRADLQKCNSNV